MPAEAKQRELTRCERCARCGEPLKCVDDIVEDESDQFRGRPMLVRVLRCPTCGFSKDMAGKVLSEGVCG
jgi:hypothetical protein